MKIKKTEIDIETTQKKPAKISKKSSSSFQHILETTARYLRDNVPVKAPAKSLKGRVTAEKKLPTKE